MIANGAIVVWSSQANASAKTKTGTIIAFVPANTDVRLLPETETLSLWPRRFDYFAASVDRYLICVKRTGTRHVLPPIYYLPLASVVERQNRSITS